MHTGDRSAEAIDAGGVLPGYQGVTVRDGHAGYGHLTSALHAGCGVHLLRDLKGLYDFEPAPRPAVWPRALAVVARAEGFQVTRSWRFCKGSALRSSQRGVGLGGRSVG